MIKKSRISFVLKHLEWNIISGELKKCIASNPNYVSAGRYLYVTDLPSCVIVTVVGTKEVPTRLDRIEKLFADHEIINNGKGRDYE